MTAIWHLGDKISDDHVVSRTLYYELLNETGL